MAGSMNDNTAAVFADVPALGDGVYHMCFCADDKHVEDLHDQGHIVAKLLAPHATIALTIGTPILFSSVAHGSAHDIAGRGIANPQAMIEAILQLSKAKQQARA